MPATILFPNEFGTLAVIEGTPFEDPQETEFLDGIYSTFTAPTSSIIYSDIMYQGDFQAEIPESAIITGFECSFSGLAFGVSTTLVLGLYIDGDLYSFEKEVGFLAVPTVIVVGASDDLWGATLTPMDINSSLFQLGFSARYNSFPFSGDVVSIDYLSLKVYWESGDDSTFRGRGGQRNRLAWGVR